MTEIESMKQINDNYFKSLPFWKRMRVKLEINWYITLDRLADIVWILFKIDVFDWSWMDEDDKPKVEREHGK